MKIINEEKMYEHHFEENNEFAEHKFSVDLKNGEIIFGVKIDKETKKELYERGYII